MQDLITAGIIIRYDDYKTIPAKVWADLVLWKEAEAVRSNKGD